MSSKLEKIIQQCRETWKKNNIDPALIDEAIDSMAWCETLPTWEEIYNLTEEHLMSCIYSYKNEKPEKDKKNEENKQLPDE